MESGLPTSGGIHKRPRGCHRRMPP